MLTKRTKLGFTLIEIIVVVSTIGIIMMVVVGSIFQIMKAQNRNEAISKLTDQGNWILSELKKNMFNSNNKLTCSPDKLSVGTTNLFDGLSTVISCDVANNKIASTSAFERELNGSGIDVVDCTNFVSCDTNPDTEVSSLTFNFRIFTKVSGVGVSQNFSTTVTLRN
jgi:prepilin-type N-terminal cleavage/methylation domain-containing protein